MHDNYKFAAKEYQIIQIGDWIVTYRHRDDNRIKVASITRVQNFPLDRCYDDCDGTEFLGLLNTLNNTK